MQLQQLRTQLNTAGNLQNENFRLMLEQGREILDAEKRRRALEEEEELRLPLRELRSRVESTLQHHGSGALVLNKPTQKEITGTSLKLA